MFETELSEKFKNIFGVKKVSFDEPSDSHEQECLFIQIETSKTSVKDGKVNSLVAGKASMFGSNEKLPFGFFIKAIKQADTSLTKDLFFFDIESNTLQYRNIIQRSFSFNYFFNSQYDPDIGTITSVEFNSEEQ